jgi:predicted dehydrogenase
MKNTGLQIDVSRRRFIKSSSLLVAGAAVAPYLAAHAAPDEPIKVGLIGCGGRGSGAIENVKSADSNVTVVAVADMFPERASELAKKLGLPTEMAFSGFDAYKKVVAIPDINYIILATPPGFRPIHLRAAVEAGKNVFMEKPVAVDGPGVRSVLESSEIAKQKGLSIIAGTQRRHQASYVETLKRLHDGAIGDVVALRAYWCQSLIWNHPWNSNISDMENQLRNWYHYIWLCGDHIVEQHLHNLDVCNWVMKDHPISAYGMGGRQGLTGRGQIYDHFAIEYEYKGGARMFSKCRQMDGCRDNVSEAVAGTKGTSNPNNSIKVNGGEDWRFKGKERNAYEQEHVDLIKSIREGLKVNEGRQVAESTLTAIMGREAAYTGQLVEWDTVLNSTKVWMPEKLEFGALPAPEIPVPGKYKLV